MNAEGEIPVSVIGAGETPGSDNHFRPRGHGHYHLDVDAEGHSLVDVAETTSTFGKGAVPTRQALGAVTVYKDVLVSGHTPSITE